MSKKILSVNSSFLSSSLALCLALGFGCSGDATGTGSSQGGATGEGGSSSGSASSSGGSGGSGGASSSSSSASGGKSAVGGSSTTVDSSASGGKSASGGSSRVDDSTGGKSGTGGSSADGGKSATGGTSKAGGTTGSGGTSASGGTTSKTGGSSAVGGSASGGTAAGGSGGSTSSGTSGGGAKQSGGCGKDPSTALKSAVVGQATPVNSISVGGAARQFLVRWPSNYDNKKPYRLHIGLHGANGDLAENGRDNFGLWSLSKDTTIFVTLAGVNKLWSGERDLAYADEVLKQVENELCIDTSRIFLEGFSMGAAMSWYLTCSRPGVYRGVAGHSGGGVNPPSTCTAVAYFGSLGTQESGNGQNTQTDRFAKPNGCTIETLPTAPAGKHVCTPYKGCKEGFPVTWCSFDGGHGFTPRDSGSSTYWMPQAVWDFISPL